MQVISIHAESDWPAAIAEAVRLFAWGGSVVYPTDTVYALGANALDPSAVRNVFRIKHRSTEKVFPLIVRNMRWAKELAHINGRAERILNAVWPGAVTVLVPKQDIVPDVVTGGQSAVGMRVPDHAFVHALLDAYGYPLIGASANVSGREGHRDTMSLVQEFEGMRDQPDLILDAGILPEQAPSTVLDISGEKPKILRVGATRPEELLKLLEI